MTQSSPDSVTPMQRLLAAAGWDVGSIRHKQLEEALVGAGLSLVETGRRAPAQAARVTGATSLVEEAAVLIWAELCPGLVMGDDDFPHYEAAAKAVLDLAIPQEVRNAVIEECAKVADDEQHVGYCGKAGAPTTPWSKP